MSPAATGPRLFVPSLRPSRKPITLIALVFGLLLCGAPASASAADLFVDGGGTLHYDGAAGRVSVVSFVEVATGTGAADCPNNPQPATGTTVCVHRDTANGDDDAINEDGVTCHDTGNGEDFYCDGVEAVEADASDRDDILSAAGLDDIPARLDGGDGNDQLFGGGGSTSDLDGGAGDDFLFAGDGGGSLEGGAGDDHIFGGSSSSSGSDTIDGGPGNDQIVGGDEADIINGGDGSDVISGEGGNDTLDGGDGPDEVDGGAGNDTVLGGEGNDDVNGDAGDDTVDGGGGGDNVAGGDGNDKLIGGEGGDSLNGGDGNDELDAGQGEDDLNGGDGNDDLDGGSGNDRMAGNDGNDTLDGGQGEDGMDGGKGNDVLEGEAGPDQLSGGAGDDKLFGGDGDDNLSGGDGDDLLNGGDGADSLFGGAGIDVADYSDAATKVTVDLGTGEACGGLNACAGAGGDTISSSVENLNGSPFNDTLIGNDLDNVINGGAGNDVINGGQGNDTENGEDGNDRFDEGDLINGSDVFSGGNGIDVVDYHARELQVSVTLDGVANDGQPNEFDNVLPDVENSLRPPAPAFPPPTPAPDLTAPSITGFKVNETRISPNGDGIQDTLDITARFSEPTSWTFEVLSGNNAIFTQIGQGTIAQPSWNGLTAAASQAVSGAYTWRITGKDAAGNQLTPKTGTIVVDRRAPRVRSLTVSRRGRVNRVRFTVNEPGTVRARIEGVRRLATIKLEEPSVVNVSWNGLDRRGRPVRSGRYLMVIVVTDPAGNRVVKRLGVRVTR